jgi:hypothetical protein
MDRKSMQVPLPMVNTDGFHADSYNRERQDTTRTRELTNLAAPVQIGD